MLPKSTIHPLSRNVIRHSRHRNNLFRISLIPYLKFMREIFTHSNNLKNFNLFCCYLYKTICLSCVSFWSFVILMSLVFVGILAISMMHTKIAMRCFYLQTSITCAHTKSSKLADKLTKLVFIVIGFMEREIPFSHHQR